MVLALAGDSTTTTSDMMFRCGPDGAYLRSGVRQQSEPVPRQCLHSPGKLQFKEDRQHGGGRQLAAPHQIVNLYGCWTEQGDHLGSRLIETWRVLQLVHMLGNARGLIIDFRLGASRGE